MNIELPKKFSMNNVRKGQKAYIENGILKLTRQVNFSKLMFELTYQIKGKNKCYYCGKKITKEQITIDHIYPIDFGGPTITNNLLPSCGECNIRKNNMTYNQYVAFLEAESIGTGKNYQKMLEKYQEEMRKECLYQIPNKWITFKDTKDIKNVILSEEDYKKKRYKYYEKYYNEYGVVKKPIIIDRNLFLLDGFLVLMLAKDYNINTIPVIKLDNVEIIF